MLENYSTNDVIKMITNRERLFLVIGGEDNYYIRIDDLPDYIVDSNSDLIIYEYDYKNRELVECLTTYGFFLNKCDYDLRDLIHDRLVKLQTFQEPTKMYKVISAETFLLVLEILDLNKNMRI